MAIRGIRGATVCAENNATAILQATKELLLAMLSANPGLRSEDIASAWFTMTADLDAVYPARAARQIGWTEVPLMCVQEQTVAQSLTRCIRVLLYWNTELSQKEVRHCYLHAAAALRPDLSGSGGKTCQPGMEVSK